MLNTNAVFFFQPARFAALVIALVAYLSVQSIAVGQTSFTSTSDTGAWNTTRWNNSADAVPYTSAYTAHNNVSFTSGNYNIAGMGAVINVGNVTLSNNVTVTFTSTSSTYATDGAVRTIDVGTGATIDFGGQPISTAGSTGFIKDGNGVLALAGGNYTGGFTLNAGTVIVRGVDAMGDGATLTINGGIIAANANRNLAGQYDNGITVNGSFTLGATTGLANAVATISFGNTMNFGGGNRTVTIGGDGDYTLGSDISNGALTVAATGNGRLFLSGLGNTYANGTTLNTGTLVINTNALPDAGAVTVNGGTMQLGTTGAQSDTVGAVTLDGGTIYSTTGILTGSSYAMKSGNLNANLGGVGALTKSTAGTVIMNGPGNSYTGGTIITGGTLQWDSGNQLFNDGTVLVNGGTLDITDHNDTVGTVTLTSGTIAGNIGTLTGSSYIVESGVISGKLGGSVPLTKNTAGTVTVTSANSYTGVTTLNAGTFSVTTLANSSQNSGIGAAQDTQPLRLVFNGGELEYAGGNVSTNRGFTLNAGGGAIDVANSGTKLTWAGEATGAGLLAKNGAGELELTFDNTYLGGTTVNAGTLIVNNTGLGSGTGSGLVTITGGTLKGTGRVGGGLNLQGSGTLGPGNSIGTLNVVGNATLAGTLAVEVSNSDDGLVDLLNGVTSLTISSGSTVNFNLLAGPLDDLAYVFANYTSLAGTFTNVQNLPAGYTIDYDYLGNSIALVPVPEPSSLAMLLFGALAMFLFRKKRL